MFKMQTTSPLHRHSVLREKYSECVCVFMSSIINGSWVQCMDAFLHSRTAVEGDELDLKLVDTRPGSACPCASGQSHVSKTRAGLVSGDSQPLLSASSSPWERPPSSRKQECLPGACLCPLLEQRGQAS